MILDVMIYFSGIHKNYAGGLLSPNDKYRSKVYVSSVVTMLFYLDRNQIFYTIRSLRVRTTDRSGLVQPWIVKISTKVGYIYREHSVETKL